MLPGVTIAFVLLCCAGVNSQSEDEYAIIADLEYCGQSCPSSCEEAEAWNAVCRCDSECERYGDCCEPQSGRLNCDSGEQRMQPLAGLQCRSIHLDNRTQPGRMEAFWMVSACPEDWLANQDDEVLREADEKCRYGSDTLPPVTDLDGGVVYKNEYCAVCHQVTNIQPWGYRFGCSPCLEGRLYFQNNLTRELIEEECIACGFRVPDNGTSPRRCLHDSLVVDECLAREVLEERTGLSWEEGVYRDIVIQCQTGPVRPVAANPCDEPPTYRNQYCAICNAKKTADLVCTNPYVSSSLSADFCLFEAEDCHRTSRSSDYSSDFAIKQGQKPENLISPIRSDLRIRKATPDTDHQTINDTVEFFPVSCPSFDVAFPNSFTLFFDVRGDSAVITSDIISTTLPVSCSKGEVFDPVDETCRQTICPEGFATFRGSCAIVQNITLNRTYNNSNDSLIVCDEGLIALHESDFEILDNDTLLFRDEAFQIVGYNGSSPIICSNFSQNGTVLRNETVLYYSYPSAFSILTYVGCSLSVAGCVLVLLTYSLFKELRSLPGQILMNLTSTILATSLFLMVGIPIISLTEMDELCEATAILLHWLILSQFSWMSIMSFELLRTLYRASHLHPMEEKSRAKKIFLLYFLIGWGTPIVVTFIAVIVNFTTDVIRYGRDGFCWIGHVPSFYAVFVAPVALSILFNGITFTITFGLLFKASRAQAKLKKQQNTSYLRVSLSVFSITGLTWIFGFVAIVARDDWAWYIFIILTSTQGLVIAIAFIFTQKVGGLYKKLILPKLQLITSSKSSTKQRTQESSLGTKSARKNGNASTASTSAQDDDARYTAVAVKNTREKENGDQLSIEMDTI